MKKLLITILAVGVCFQSIAFANTNGLTKAAAEIESSTNTEPFTRKQLVEAFTLIGDTEGATEIESATDEKMAEINRAFSQYQKTTFLMCGTHVGFMAFIRRAKPPRDRQCENGRMLM